MWIFTNKGFLSVVQHKDDPVVLLVRSRFAGHVKALFPKARVIKTPDADYRYRAIGSRRQFACKLAEAAKKIDYTNFKNSLEDERYHEACMDVWLALYKHQER